MVALQTIKRNLISVSLLNEEAFQVALAKTFALSEGFLFFYCEEQSASIQQHVDQSKLVGGRFCHLEQRRMCRYVFGTLARKISCNLFQTGPLLFASNHVCHNTSLFQSQKNIRRIYKQDNQKQQCACSYVVMYNSSVIEGGKRQEGIKEVGIQKHTCSDLNL